MSNENFPNTGGPAPAPTDNPNRPPRDYSALPGARLPQGLDARAELRAYITVECFPGRLAMSSPTNSTADSRRKFAAEESVKDADAILTALKL